MRRLATIVLALLPAFGAAAGGGRIVIVNANAAGQGFNDPRPATPVGNNTGTTIGAQRLNVFQAAADHWTKVLDISVNVVVSASFAPLQCNDTEGVLGQAGPMAWRHSFPGAPRANVWYPIALANQLAGADLDPTQADIFAQFNSSLDESTCLGDSGWYYGLDNQHGTNTNLYLVVLHELAHGLGFAGALGAPGFLSNLPSIFDVHTMDLTLGLRWDQMSEVQRTLSMTNTSQLVWDGPLVSSFTGRYLEPITRLAISTPPLLEGEYDVGSAEFGPALGTAPMSGSVVQALDAADTAGPTTTDGCSTISNASALAGKIAIVDRGTCNFTLKALNVQAAGAIGLIVADNRTTCIPPTMGGTAAEVVIPAVSIGVNDAAAIKAQLANSVPVNAMLRTDASQLAGRSTEGFMRLYAPCTAEPGSSVFHWDVMAHPNLLMEPAINGDLRHDLDLTLFQMMDIGWPTRTGRRTLLR